jgi:hypothetical protein
MPALRPPPKAGSVKTGSGLRGGLPARSRFHQNYCWLGGCLAVHRFNVRFGSLADIRASRCHVRFTSNNGRWAAVSIWTSVYEYTP